MPQKDATLGILTDKVGRLACQKCGEELDVSEYSIFEHVLCPVCQHEISVPAKLGNFMLIDEIGKGGMGAVYLAKDESLGRDVALKVMRQEYGNDPRFLDRLLKEAQAAAALNHPNVVQVYTFGQEMGQPYIVMELVNGGRLDLHMKRSPQVDELIVLDTALDVAKGLQAAADAGLIHGDIKPANILYDRQNHAKVVDFGLAKFEGGAKTKGEIWGTPYYIAPEKARGKSEDSRSDQYSLGATLHHALTGKPPFDGETAADVVVARLKNPPPDIRTLNPKVTEKTAAIVLRMMESAPERRYPTYKSLLADLQGARQDLLAARQQASAKGKGGRTAAAARTESSGGGKGILYAVAGLVVVGGIVAAVVLKGRGSKPETPSTPAQVPAAPAGPMNSWVNHQASDISPFSRAESQILLDAIKLVTDALGRGEAPRSLGALAKIGQVMVKHPDVTSPGHAWCLFYQAQVHLMCNEGDAALEALKSLIATKIKYVGVQREDPRVLAELIGGKHKYAAVKANTRDAAPWFQQLVDFCGAYRMVLVGEPAQVSIALSGYANAAHDAFWPYAFQGLAKAMSGQGDELARVLALTDEKARAEQLVSFGGRYPLWKSGLQKASAGMKLPRGDRSYVQIMRELKPLALYRLNERSPGRLQAEVDPQMAAAATYVVQDGLGKSDGALGPGDGFDAGNVHLNLAERNSFDYVNNLVSGGKISGKAGAVVFWFRTKERSDREMFFARASDNTPLRVRLGGDGRPQIEAGENGSGGRVVGSVDVADGKWHQIAAVWNRADGQATLVVDGASPTSGKLTLPDAPFTLVRFGRNDQGGSQYKGDLDELAVWDRALTPAELAQLTAR